MGCANRKPTQATVEENTCRANASSCFATLGSQACGEAFPAYKDVRAAMCCYELERSTIKRCTTSTRPDGEAMAPLSPHPYATQGWKGNLSMRERAALKGW